MFSPQVSPVWPQISWVLGKSTLATRRKGCLILISTGKTVLCVCCACLCVLSVCGMVLCVCVQGVRCVCATCVCLCAMCVVLVFVLGECACVCVCVCGCLRVSVCVCVCSITTEILWIVLEKACMVNIFTSKTSVSTRTMMRNACLILIYSTKLMWTKKAKKLA